MRLPEFGVESFERGGIVGKRNHGLGFLVFTLKPAKVLGA